MEVNKIYQGDTLTILKSLDSDFIDIGVTSPPYNKMESKNNGWLTTNVIYDSISDSKNEELYQQEQIETLNELYRTIKPGGSFFYNHKTRWNKGVMIHPMDWLRKTNWLIRQEIIWDRMIASNIRGWRFWQIEERIYWLYKPIGNNNIGKELLSKHALLTSIWRLTPEKKSLHPAPFPIEIPTRIIHSILDDNDGLVIDPYCGHGTSLVASKLLNKNYIGIDISDKYIDYSKQRLIDCENPNHKDNIKLNEEIKKHIVTKTFKQRKEAGNWTKKKSKII